MSKKKWVLIGAGILIIIVMMSAKKKDEAEQKKVVKKGYMADGERLKCERFDDCTGDIEKGYFTDRKGGIAGMVHITEVVI